MHNRLFKTLKILFLSFLLITPLCAQEVITGLDAKKDLPVLNEELQKLQQGVLLPKGAIFFMITGSCPKGTTDVTSTYSNKFVRINATGGSTGGADTHSHTSGAATITGATDKSNEDGNIGFGSIAGGGVPYTEHTHNKGTLAVSVAATASGSNVPAFVTAKMCQVN